MEPAGCGYWRRAAAGEVFFTVADDHKRCPVGAHTHNVPLSASEQQELMGLVQTMVGLSYLKMEEVPQIPTPQDAAAGGRLRAAGGRAGAARRGAGARQRPAADAARRSGAGRRRGGKRRDDGTADLRRAAGGDQLRRARPPVSAASATASTPAPAKTTPTSPFPARSSRPSRRAWR